jgi:hypothetical protein
MSRSVNYLNRALKVSYFEWPRYSSYNEETEQDEISEDYEDSYIVIEDIQESIMSEFPEFDRSKKWDSNEVSIILQGHGAEIGLAEYCGLASLSIRIDENELDYNDYNEAEYNEQYDKILSWINENWPRISAGYSQFNKVATFSNGEAIFEKNNK